MQFRLPPVQPDAAVIGGGMNLTVSPMFAKPGTAFMAYNYEYAVNGGVERVRGFEPYDGRPAPSNAQYTKLVCNAPVDGAVSVGDTVEGGTSGATGVVIWVSGNTLAVSKVTLAFDEEPLLLGVTTVAQIIDTAGEVDGFTDNNLFKCAADLYQADIGKVPGTGPVLGVTVLNDVVYAWRNTADFASALKMYRASATGWQEVTTPALLPLDAERVRTDEYSFTASVDGKVMYGCDGKNPEFMFDGTTYTQLSTGMAPIRATAVLVHKNHLFFGYRGSLQHSSIGAPTTWSAVTGAGEFATGDVITNLVSFGGQADAAAMMVTCENALFVLYGTSVDDWQLVPLSRKSGAAQNSVQDIGGIVAVDTPGVMRYPAGQSFGNFEWNTVSMEIQPLVRDQKVAASVYVSNFFKYRVFFTDGTAVSGLPVKNGFAWSVLNYGRTITCAKHAEVAGNARTFMGDDRGWVYEADKGRSFAGEPIQYVLKLHPLAQRGPMVEKAYRQMQVEITSQSACRLLSSADFGDGDGDSDQTETPQYGPGLVYDLANYDESFWDVAAHSRRTMPLDGVGSSVAITLAGESAEELTHTIYAVSVLYTPRKIQR
jgi:hypothetical protein